MAGVRRHDPFDLDAPAVVAFSGGRTSGYMLRRLLDVHRPEHVVFTNTGKERLETLDFVREVERRWEVPIVWLEYRYDAPVPCPTRHDDYTTLTLAEKADRWSQWGEAMMPFRESGVRAAHRFRGVTYETASRQGQPFEEAMGARGWPPNRVARYCTAELKVKTMWRWAKSIGLERYTKAVGLRADEPGRVERLLANAGEYRASEEIVCPLAEAGLTLADVTEFWSRQPFDLALRPEEGNCDLCFLKRKGVLLRLMEERPESAQWWVEQEKRGGLFRSRADRPPYANLLKMASEPRLFDGPDDEDDIPCACTD